jgi:hypothetical protein
MMFLPQRFSPSSPLMLMLKALFCNSSSGTKFQSIVRGPSDVCELHSGDPKKDFNLKK